MFHFSSGRWRGIELQKNLAPAEIGWGTIENHDDDFCRRWITRTDKRQIDPFGEPTVHAMMHPGFQNPDYIGPSGPIDPDLTILSIRGSTGRPIAVLANYSMHYFGSPLLSADYFGLFAAGLANRLQAGEQSPAFVGIMSQGTSGDSMWRDYGRREHNRGIDEFSRGMVERAMRVYEQIAYQSRPEVAMIETTLTLGRRTPSPERLAKSAEIIARLAGQLPQSRPEVYAWEQQYLHDEPRRELKLQVIRIGEFGIAAWPNEVFNLTGLKLKARSPLPTLMNIELANGTEGYIPSPSSTRSAATPPGRPVRRDWKFKPNPKSASACSSCSNNWPGDRAARRKSPVEAMSRPFWTTSLGPIGV